MQVLSCAKDEEIDQPDEYLEKVSLSIEEATSSYPFDMMTKKE
jgi:ABC-type histidine transport system ATPase subunit